MLRSAYYAALQTLGLPALARRLRDGGVILCYHNVAPTGDAPLSGEPGVHLSLEKFASQVEWLARHYDVVPLHELLDRLAARRPLRDLAAITFDDGYRGVFEHAWPLLLELGLPATVFVVADAPETGDPFWWDHPAAAQRATPELREHWLKDLRGDGAGIISALSAVVAPAFPRALHPADWATIGRATDAGLSLGVHSATHRTLTELDDVALEREVVTSWETIRRRGGGRPEIFAYPYGRWDARARDAVRAAGYRGAVTLDYGLVRPNADLWTLPRVNIPASISQSAFQAWVAGLAPRRGHV